MSNLRSSDDNADFSTPEPSARAARFEKVVKKHGTPTLPPTHSENGPDPRTVAFAEQTLAMVPHCPLCGALMTPGKGSVSGATIAMGVIGMVCGMVVCFLCLPIGIVAGLPVIIGSAILGSIRDRGLRCRNARCGHFIPRQ